jgi:hypothetical protein
MRRLAVLAVVPFVLAIAFPLLAQAQMGGQGIDVKPGVRGGVSFMTLDVDDSPGDADPDPDRRTGLMIGGFALLEFAGPFALQPELMYIQKGASLETTVDETTITSTTRLDYVEIPVLAKFQLPASAPVSPSLFAGPTLGFNVAAETEVETEVEGGESETNDVSDQVSGTDFGIALGGGVDIGLTTGTLMIDVRYALGLTNVDDTDEDTSINNQGFMITAGFAF